MGYRSNVSIIMEEKIYNEVKANMNAFTYENGEHMSAHCTKVRTASDGSKEYLLEWHDVKWYRSYEDVSSVEDVLDKYRDEEIDGYRFKKIEVGEDNQTEKVTNDWDWSCDFYPITTIEIPSGFEAL